MYDGLNHADSCVLYHCVFIFSGSGKRVRIPGRCGRRRQLLDPGGEQARARSLRGQRASRLTAQFRNERYISIDYETKIQLAMMILYSFALRVSTPLR